jgi:hypothetical protein
MLDINMLGFWSGVLVIYVVYIWWYFGDICWSVDLLVIFVDLVKYKVIWWFFLWFIVVLLGWNVYGLVWIYMGWNSTWLQTTTSSTT